MSTPLNDHFLAVYHAAAVGDDARPPVLVVLADRLVLVQQRQRRELSLRDGQVDALKAIAHAPVALFTLLRAAPRQPHHSDSLRALRQLIAAHPTSTDDARAVLRDCLALVDEAQKGAVEPGRLAAFAARTGALVLRLTDEATRVQLATLDEAVNRAVAALTPLERRTLEVVVAGAHQARARSLGMQYFEKRLGEPSGEERRVAYGEGITDVDGALELVGKRRFDRTLAAAFFGDARRLQRDVLADAAAAQLAQTDWPPL